MGVTMETEEQEGAMSGKHRAKRGKMKEKKRVNRESNQSDLAEAER